MLRTGHLLGLLTVASLVILYSYSQLLSLGQEEDRRVYFDSIPQISTPWNTLKKGCYNGNDDWSKCAGDHLLYPPSNAKTLLNKNERPLMCIHEPFCWKQLDWQHTDPPEWSCSYPSHHLGDGDGDGSATNLLLRDMSFHDAVMGSAAPMIEKSLNAKIKTRASHRVELCNYKGAAPASRNYAFDYKECPSKEADLYFDKNVSALIFGFDPNLFEEWIDKKKPLILAFWHIANMRRCTKESSQATFDKIIGLVQDTTMPHIIGANTLYHMEYIRHYTGLNPIFLPATLTDAMHDLKVSWKQERSEFLWNNDLIEPPKSPTLDDSGSNSTNSIVLSGPPKKYQLADLAKFAGVVIVPYSITNGKVVEQYALNIPMFAPTAHFARNMINDRTAVYGPYCPEMNATDHPDRHRDSPYEYSPNVRIDTDGEDAGTDVEFWIKFAEIYQWPCIQYFNSWEDMFQLLKTADLEAMNVCMKQANKWRHFEEVQNWCWATNYIQKHTAQSTQSVS